MDNYRILLVDDEEEVRQAIARKLDWQALGFELVGEASNGEEALELLETRHPDVIFTDIKMPFMDGLTLCRKAKQMAPGIKVAIFSGFDDFEYAKEAIKLEVEEYILKPIDAQELADVFRRLKQSMDEELAARKDIDRLQRYYKESLPLMRQQALLGLLEGRTEPAFVAQKSDEYDLPLAAPKYCAAVIRYEAGAPADQLLPVSLQRLVRDVLPADANLYLVPALDRIAVLFLLPESGTERDVMAMLERLFVPAQKFYAALLSIGVGSCCAALDGVAKSYAEAVDALEYQILMEPGQCIFIGDLQPVADSAGFEDVGGCEEVVRQIKIGSDEGLQKAVETLAAGMKKQARSLQFYQIFLMELSTELMRLVKTYGLDEAGEDLTKPLLRMSYSDFGNWDEFGRWLYEYCDRLRHLIRRERKDTTRLLIDKAKDYLAENYQNGELSVEMVSGHLNVTPTYFSTLFKKETGQNFVAYLTQIRLEKALELLNTTDDKTYMIAEKVGYADANYFSYVFKKQYGISPTKYRANRMIEHGETAQPL